MQHQVQHIIYQFLFKLILLQLVVEVWSFSSSTCCNGACSGSNSVFSTINFSAGGGYGGSGPGPKSSGANGGSGGGRMLMVIHQVHQTWRRFRKYSTCFPPQGQNGSLGHYNNPNGSGAGGGGGGGPSPCNCTPGSSGGGIYS